MARPKKCRRVCHYPNTLAFGPEESWDGLSAIILTVDEYETIRLIDKEGLDQEACSDSMQVARTTVQQIYTSARKKLADVLVEGRPLRIAGGDFRLCDGENSFCHRGTCFKQQFYQQYSKPKGDSIMRIAVTYENGMVFQHFGHTQQFKVYDVQDGKVISGGGHQRQRSRRTGRCSERTECRYSDLRRHRRRRTDGIGSCQHSPLRRRFRRGRQSCRSFPCRSAGL